MTKEEDKDRAVILSPEEQNHLKMLEDLNKPRGLGIRAGLKTRLHSGQIEVLTPIYKQGKKRLFLPCGRKFAKTETTGYALWKQALTKPYSACYYVAPEASHGRKIIWDTNRLQRFLDEDSAKYIKSIKNMEMKIEFNNGSFIQVVGSENFGAANGLTPDIAVYDEFKLFHRRWHIDFAPNLVVRAAPIIVIGTLPTVGDRNYDQYFEMLEAAKKDKENSSVFYKSTFDNPINHLPEIKKAIEIEIDALRARGEEDVVQREYYSKIVPGGKRAIFPMLRKKHVMDARKMHDILRRDMKKLEWYCITDPGSTTCFAAIIAAMNPYTKDMYIVHELYEKDQHMTSTRMIYPRLEALMQKVYPNSSINDDWIKVMDEAAAWFSNEAMSQYGVYFMPTDKANNKKEAGLSLMKDQLIHEVLHISSECPNLYNEMEKYARDDKGNIPKRDDHLIDTVRYLNSAANYNMHEVLEAVRSRNADTERRFRGLNDDPDLGISPTWIDDLFTDF